MNDFVPKGYVSLTSATLSLARADDGWTALPIGERELDIWHRVETGRLYFQGIGPSTDMAREEREQLVSRVCVYEDKAGFLRRELHDNELAASILVSGQLAAIPASFWGSEQGDWPFGDGRFVALGAIWPNRMILDFAGYQVLLKAVDLARLMSEAPSTTGTPNQHTTGDAPLQEPDHVSEQHNLKRTRGRPKTWPSERLLALANKVRDLQHQRLALTDKEACALIVGIAGYEVPEASTKARWSKTLLSRLYEGRELMKAQTSGN